VGQFLSGVIGQLYTGGDTVEGIVKAPQSANAPSSIVSSPSFKVMFDK